MVTINSITYKDYYEMCKALNISYKDLINYKQANPDISELGLLDHFIPNIVYRIAFNDYATIKRKN